MGKTLIIVLIILVIGGLATQRYLNKQREEALNEAAPLQTFQVEVIDKREYRAQDRRSRQREIIAGEELRYEVRFRILPAGVEDKAFDVSVSCYENTEKGSRGLLSLKGTRFVAFESEKGNGGCAQ